ncbi:ComF family protein [Flavobacterium arsenatis]|uniref:ComF family protein n=1 Tax=Flavobacterium arsenatis TaxID=1484332 RepID=A0ABU1TTE7_9FLAO|nr:ComF family protein [Flavobacterium arsenatis]MDR6969143.1 ComF family protein [Flavobacterium arsenatis]
MLEALTNLFFPKACVGCDAFLLTNEIVICAKCRHEIPLTTHHLNPENEVTKQFYGRMKIEYGSSFMYFHKKGMVQEIIHGLKYHGHEEIGTLIGNWYADDLKKIEILKTVDEIIPVPLHPRKLKERGFNQVTTFGKSLSENLAIAYDENLLHRNIYSKTQTFKNLIGRTDNAEAIFDVTFNENHHNKHFLLVDDVLTSGATLEACGKAILKIPGAKLSVVTMAYSHS